MPFEIGSFLKAPYGWSRLDRRNGPRRSLSKREVRRANALGVLWYLVLAAGIWFGVRTWHGLPGALGGVAIAVGVMSLGVFVVSLVIGVSGVRRDSRHRSKGSGTTSLE